MSDRYSNFEELSRKETAGDTYRILLRQAHAGFAILTPHGGGIEPGTSEISDAIAGERFSFYAFEGLKGTENKDLHITSTRFDEPMCLMVIARSQSVVTIHGEHSETDGEGVFIGGLDEELKASFDDALTAKGFDVRKHSDPNLQGREPKNLCNRGVSGKGVQFELSKSVRLSMFSSLLREGRKHTTDRFTDFVDAVQSVLHKEAPTSATGASF
jgi:phage replication-related protein YjqB (UPF0714/DUF867 family)